MHAPSRILPSDPRLRVLYLLTMAAVVFAVRDAAWLLALLGLQTVLWLTVRLGARRLVRQVAKLWGFAAFIVVSYALTSEAPEIDRWVELPVLGSALRLNVGGVAVALTMLGRVVVVVLASQIARAGDERAIAQGLSRIGIPRSLAAAIDAVLALGAGAGGAGHGPMHASGGGGGRGGGGGGGGGRGGGRGRGGGGGGRRRDGDASDVGSPYDLGEQAPSFWQGVKRLARGDVRLLTARIDASIDRAEQHLRERGEGAGGSEATSARSTASSVTVRTGRDASVVAGLAVTMLGIKALKVLPSIPFAPGHKLVVLTPLYVLAALRTRSRLGATLTGATMGTVAFLMGDGRYGIFEILKHIAPGLVADALVPFVARRPSSRIGWAIVGGLMGVGRVFTIFGVTFAVQAPKVAYAFLLPALAVHTTFGILSGIVTHSIVQSFVRSDERTDAPPRPVQGESPGARGQTTTHFAATEVALEKESA